MGDSKKTKILDAAIKVFAEKGYQYATIAEIAREAGISTGLVYSYFENKLDLLLSINLRFFQMVNVINQKKLAQIADPVEKLFALFRTYHEILLHDKKSLYWGTIIREGFPQPHLVKSKKLKQKQLKIYEENKQLLKTIDDIVIEGQRRGKIDATLKPQLLRQIFGGTSQTLFNGLFLQYYRQEEIGYDREDIPKAMTALLGKFITR